MAAGTGGTASTLTARIRSSSRGRHNAHWETTTLEATCSGDRERCLEHLKLDECNCGIYLVQQKPDVEQWQHSTSEEVLAQCIGYGVILECERGARVSKARIIGMTLPSSKAGHADALRQRYNCPVEIVGDVTAELPNWLKDGLTLAGA